MLKFSRATISAVAAVLCIDIAVAAVPEEPFSTGAGMVPFSVSDGLVIVRSGQWTTVNGTGELVVCKDDVISASQCSSWRPVAEHVKAGYPQSKLVGYQLIPVATRTLSLVLYLKKIK